MVQILEDVPSFGSQFAKSIGQGVSQGLSNSSDMAMQMTLEKYRDKLKRGYQNQQAAASFGLNAEDLMKGNKASHIEQNKNLLGSQNQKPSSNLLLDAQQIKDAAKQKFLEESQQGLYRSEGEITNDILQKEELKKADIARGAYYGDVAQESLDKVYPEASDEMKSVIRKKLEQGGKTLSSDADLKRLAAVEAKKLKNQIASVKKSLPNRLWSTLKGKALGTFESSEKQVQADRRKLQGLLKEGLFDESRALLSGNGFSPEEVERRVSSLGETTQKLLNQYQDQTKTSHKIFPGLKATQLPEEQQQVFEDNLNSILKADPTTNLILLRREYEGKGVDWRSFKDAVGKAFDEGLIKDDSQINAMDIIAEPPLNDLQKILHGLNLIGR